MTRCCRVTGSTIGPTPPTPARLCYHVPWIDLPDQTIVNGANVIDGRTWTAGNLEGTTEIVNGSGLEYTYGNTGITITAPLFFGIVLPNLYDLGFRSPWPTQVYHVFSSRTLGFAYCFFAGFTQTTDAGNHLFAGKQGIGANERWVVWTEDGGGSATGSRTAIIEMAPDVLYVSGFPNASVALGYGPDLSAAPIHRMGGVIYSPNVVLDADSPFGNLNWSQGAWGLAGSTFGNIADPTEWVITDTFICQ